MAPFPEPPLLPDALRLATLALLLLLAMAVAGLGAVRRGLRPARALLFTGALLPFPLALFGILATCGLPAPAPEAAALGFATLFALPQAGPTRPWRRGVRPCHDAARQ